MKMKTVVICLHGLIKDAPHDFTAFKQYVEESNIDVKVELPMLYDITNPKTFKFKTKCRKIDAMIANYEEQDYDIILIGYSFSTGLCAKMCKKHKIKKIILVSPVIKIISRKGIKFYLKTIIKSFKSKTKARINKKRRDRLKKLHSLYLFDLLMSCFHDIHKTKRSYKYINCPTMLMYGNNDEITYLKHLRYIHKKVKKTNYFEVDFYNNANHVFIMSTKIDKTSYYNDMIRFINWNA